MTAFKGTSNYIASDDLQLAVNAAIHLERPLLIKGEPGTGKTLLAEELAASLGTELISWHIKSTTKHNKACMNMMQYQGYVIVSLVTTKYMILLITLLKVNCGMHLLKIIVQYC